MAKKEFFVLIYHVNKSPLSWHLCIPVKILPYKEYGVIVVQFKNPQFIFTHPVHKLVPLPTDYIIVCFILSLFIILIYMFHSFFG